MRRIACLRPGGLSYHDRSILASVARGGWGGLAPHSQAACAGTQYTQQIHDMRNPVSRSLLCVDVGNSRTKFGLFRRHAQPRAPRTLPRCDAQLTLANREIGSLAGLATLLGIAADESVAGLVAGSNPAGVARVIESWPAHWDRPALLDDASRCPIEIRVAAPNKVGFDRILNAVACNVIRPAATPAIVIDTGTATTVDLVSADGAFEGGAILPGFELSARALNQYTALLPYLTIEELAVEPHEPLGRNTFEALRSGLLWGQVGAIKELAMQYRTRCPVEPFVVVTGGGAPLAARHLPQARCEPHLSLQGLALVGETAATGRP
jgi:type III pantothenate kinase